MPKFLEPVRQYWPIVLSLVALIAYAAKLDASVSADRELFQERLASNHAHIESETMALKLRLAAQESYNTRVTILLEQVVPDYKARLAVVEEKNRAIEERVKVLESRPVR